MAPSQPDLNATLNLGVNVGVKGVSTAVPATLMVRHAAGGWTCQTSIPAGQNPQLKAVRVPAGTYSVEATLPSGLTLCLEGEIAAGQAQSVLLAGPEAMPHPLDWATFAIADAASILPKNQQAKIAKGLQAFKHAVDEHLPPEVTASLSAEGAKVYEKYKLPMQRRLGRLQDKVNRWATSSGGLEALRPVPEARSVFQRSWKPEVEFEAVRGPEPSGADGGGRFTVRYWLGRSGTWSALGAPSPFQLTPEQPVVRVPSPLPSSLSDLPGFALAEVFCGGPGSLPEFCMLPVGWQTRRHTQAEVSLLVNALPKDTPEQGLRVRVRAAVQDPDLALLMSAMKTADDRLVDGVVAKLAEGFLFEKFNNPMMAAAAALTLLKLRQLDRLHDWTYTLASKFPTLPDGAVVRAWHLLLGSRPKAGDPHDTPRHWLLESRRRGIPLFFASLRLMVDGLQLLAHSSESVGQGGPEVVDQEAYATMKDCQAYLWAADADEDFTSYRGNHPEEPGLGLTAAKTPSMSRPLAFGAPSLPPSKSATRTTRPKPMNKKYLHTLLRDKAVMEDLANQASSLPSLESVGGGGINPVQLNELLSQNESAVTPGSLTMAEAIILERGRPPLLVQDGKWEEPSIQELRNWLNPARDSLLAALPKVGRVEILNYGSDFIGTGWMIAEDLLITNRHVAELFGLRRGQAFDFRSDPFNGKMKVRVDFLREHDRANTAQFVVEEIKYIEESSQLRPDMALVRLNASGSTLPAPLELNSQLATREQPVAVIGYPAEDSRNDSFVMRNVFRGIYNVKRLCPGRIIGMRQDGKMLEHDSSTLGGASGSAVVDLSTGRVCGLHFGGEYKVSNVCVSSAWLRSRLAELEPLRISGLRGVLEGRLAAAPAVGGGGGGGQPGTGAAPAAAPPPPVPPTETRPNVEAGRDGYDPDFLQAEDAAEPDENLRVPLPVLSTPLEAEIAPVKDSTDGLLHYTHFSLLMHKGRRLPFYTAVNINGNLLHNIIRGQDRWYTDLRLVDPDHQIGEGLYKGNKLDRGHLVRRLDPTWGETRAEAKQAEEDTFFFTNCSPQHAKLNQKTWLSLEEYILSNAGTHKLKVSVFSGPVMQEKDEEYRGVQLPEEFWKVVTVVNADTGRLSATGYVLSQRDYLGDLEFTYGDFNSYQVALTTIENATGLSFNLSDYDPLHLVESSTPGRLIQGAEDLVL